MPPNVKEYRSRLHTRPFLAPKENIRSNTGNDCLRFRQYILSSSETTPGGTDTGVGVSGETGAGVSNVTGAGVSDETGAGVAEAMHVGNGLYLRAVGFAWND